MGRSPGEETATQSSIRAWRVSWTEELKGLQSMGLQSWTRLSNSDFHTVKDLTWFSFSVLILVNLTVEPAYSMLKKCGEYILGRGC